MSAKPFTEKRNLPPPDQVDEGHAWPAAIDILATNHNPCQERGNRRGQWDQLAPQTWKLWGRRPPNFGEDFQ